MTKKRFIVETGTGVDLHGEDVTVAACRAVRDAISRSCLCGLQEVLELKSYDQVEVEILITSPKPDEVDLDQVKKLVPMECRNISSVQDGSGGWMYDEHTGDFRSNDPSVINPDSLTKDL